MKGEDIMMYKTPLRLIAIGESPPEEDEHDGAPVISISEEQAITRKVPESAMIAAHEELADSAKRLPRWHRLLPAAVVAVIMVVLVVALAGKARKIAAPVASRPTIAPLRGPAAPPPQPSLARPMAATEQAPAARGVAETIRVHVTAEPVEAELSLDGNVVAGHRLNLEVPKDRGIHVVSASAPGYIPFNQQVAFSGDVVLAINLRRGHAPAAHAPARARAPQPEPRPKSEAKTVSPQAGFRVEPGMNLEGPALRPNAKPIDERNPYKP